MNGLDQSPTGQLSSQMLANPDLVSYDTEAVGPSQRLDYWQNQVRRGDGLKLVCSTSDFRARIRSRDLGHCKIYGLTTLTPHRAIRTESRKDVCFINLQLGSSYALFRGAHEVNMTAGSMSIYEAVPGYEIDIPGDSCSVVLAMPKHYLEKEIPNFSRHLDEVLPYNPQLISVLAHMCEKLLSDEIPLRQPVIDELGTSIQHLLLAILNDSAACSDTPPTIGQVAIVNRVKTHIRHNIADPDLSPSKVAEKTGITVSYLHKVFRNEQTTLMQFVLNERLERCRADIAKFERSANISQIAFSWGFNDASHFTRSFRKKFGMSPRQYRQQVEQQARRHLAG